MESEKIPSQTTSGANETMKAIHIHPLVVLLVLQDQMAPLVLLLLKEQLAPLVLLVQEQLAPLVLQ